MGAPEIPSEVFDQREQITWQTEEELQKLAQSINIPEKIVVPDQYLA
jgi:hypothetical protein